MKNIVSILIFILGFCTTVQAQLTTYNYPAEARISPFYKMSVTQNDNTQTPTVLVSECPDGPFSQHKIWITVQDRSMSFCNFDFSGEPVQVAVTKLWGTKANNVEITPKRFGTVIDYFDGHTVKFTLEKPEYVSVRFVCDDNTDEFNNIKNGLMVFADHPETEIPKITDKGVSLYGKDCDLMNAEVIYFKPGVYNLFDLLPNGMLNLHDNQSMYVAGGAYVYGTVNGSGTVNARIFGRGVISGFKHEFHYDGISQSIEMDPSNHRINTKRGRNHTIEGVTLLESVNHTLVVPEKSLVKDTKFISWACNNDGLRSGDGSVVDHVFMKLSDDYFYGTSSTLITRSVFWPMFNGGTIQLGWGNNFCDNGARFLNNDIINPEWDWIGSNTGFIASQCKPDARISNILIEDLHIDGNINALAALDFAIDQREYNYNGFIKDITFRNVDLNGQQIWFSPNGWDDYERVETQLSRDYSNSPENPARGGKSILKGAKSEDGRISYVENITFENVKMNGEWITEKNYRKYFDVDSQTTRNITFSYNPQLVFKERTAYTSTADYAKQGIGFLKSDVKNSLGKNAGWLTKGDKVELSLNIPSDGKYEVRYSIMPLYGDVKVNLKVGKSSSETLEIELPRDNAFGNIKKVCKTPFQLSKGNNKLMLEVTDGNCYVDLIEIVPESEIKGTPDYFVYTYWHGVLKKPISNWVSASLSFAVTDDTLYVMQRGRFGNDMRIKDFAADNADDNNHTLTFFDSKGKMLLEKRGANEINRVDISKLPTGSYFALLSDDKSYFVAKQFVKY
jgi:hypothetical protein